ncbi:glycosyltransferase [Candidatus Woesearchaeota archaeon]|jgi:glycosyltransferase involved in cell wall biosynthesis|nr:glycosyltransferase [Candidatus Woesearchaeota archaeon]MBT4387376.1 glycosyltransferase [Candidatus Woesearchaeota archaeon]MBT4595514.1 glycosyltransferase [Candidatus Woesearchaeota archaeon]MBT5741004.1 glycosyltransferase [Candidatus Woesearchaeota archaeon]MBT6506011.1 glycosyltransferase [Candidatus Woesearchaeota archaeon]
MKEKSQITIIAPHPDDEWIGCGCTILNNINSKNIKIIYVTNRLENRTVLAKENSKEFGYEIIFLKHNEKNININDLKKQLIKEVGINDIVYIPTIDTHPDHQLINIISREVLKNKKYEYAIYNNSNNIFIKIKNAIKQKITGINTASFSKGKSIVIKGDIKKKIQIIKKYGEIPRNYDIIRESKSKLLMGPYNIVFLTKDYNIKTVDAGFTAIIDLSIEFKKLGHNPILISNKGGSFWEPAANKKHEIFKGIDIYRPYGITFLNDGNTLFNPGIIFNKFFSHGFGLNYVKNKNKIKFDFIHGSSSSPILFFNVLFSKIFSWNSKLVHTIRSESIYKNAYDKIFCKIINLSDLIIVNLNTLKLKLIKGGVDFRKIKLILSGVKRENFSKRIVNHTLKNKLGIKENEKVVLYYGKGGKNKGVEYLINATNLISKKEKIKFVLIHPVVWLPHIIKKVNESKNKDKIILKTGKIKVSEFLSLASVLVLPYLTLKGTEGNPLCLIEGMINKVPIVTTNQPELREIVKNESEVLMAQPGNSKSLLENIKKILNNKKLAKKLTQNCEKIIKKFSIENIANQHIYEYHILKNK